MMLSIDEVNEILDDYYDQIPMELFAWLNGGVVLLEDALPAPEAGEDVYVMGQYCCDEMGRYIKIYYGSFAALLADEPREVWEEELWITLRHELTHHMEGLAGERSLERKDSEQLERLRAEGGAGQ
jgi:predicted Zn-dependent protease with MMP-like domain